VAENEVEIKRQQIPTESAPADLALGVRALADSARAFATTGRISQEFADLLASAKLGMALAQVDSRLLGEVLAQNAKAAQFFASYGPLVMAMQDAKHPLIMKDLTLSFPSPAVFRIQAPLAVVLRARDAKIRKLEERVSNVEAAIKKLQEELDNPDLPEEYKKLVRKLLKDVQGQDYFR